MIGAKAPFWIKERGYFGEEAETYFFVYAFFTIFLPYFFEAEDVNGAAIAAAGQPLWVNVESDGVDGGVVRAPSKFLDALCCIDVKNSNDCSLFWGSCQFVSIGAQFKGKDCGFVGVYFFLLLLVDWDFYLSYFFCGVGEDESVSHRADGAESSGVRTGLDDV